MGVQVQLLSEVQLIKRFGSYIYFIYICTRIKQERFSMNTIMNIAGVKRTKGDTILWSKTGI